MNVDDLVASLQVKQVTDRLAAKQRFLPLEFIQSRVREHRPKGVDIVVYVEPTARRWRTPYIRLVTFGRFRSAYTIIERMARILGPVALETDLLPLVVPAPTSSLRGMTEATPFVRVLQERGELLYRSESA